MKKKFNRIIHTPDPLFLNNILNEMVELGIEYCFMEVSSHAISQNRIYGLTYAARSFYKLIP